MAKRGPKPVPTNLRILNGNPSRRGYNPNEPNPRLEIPKPPTVLKDEALAEWNRVTVKLYKLGLLTGVDRAALAAYCQAWARWLEAEGIIAVMKQNDPTTAALMVKTPAGAVIQNPVVGIANRAMADLVKYAEQFGMTPAARSRINLADTLGDRLTATHEQALDELERRFPRMINGKPVRYVEHLKAPHVPTDS